VTVSNAQIAELLAVAAEAEEGHRRQALERASRAAMFTWLEEAFAVASPGRSLTELRAVGPWLARRLQELFDDPPEPADPPEIRRGFLSLAEARAAIRDASAQAAAIGGADLQFHTLETDGKSTLDEMVAGLRARGSAYAAVTDHSQGLKIARGMDEGRLALQGQLVRAVNRALDAEGAAFRLLHGIEMNLSPDGAGDMDPDALAGLDVVLGAFHSALRLEEDQTERYVAAVHNPTIDVLAHPTTRRFGGRLGLHADWRRVFEAAAEEGRIVEIDGSPARQDLPVELIRVALETEVRFSLGSDAHHTRELAYLDHAVAAALIAGVPPDRIVNAGPVERAVRCGRADAP
jgi:histidinol phosphatase-like PHP family hydrolase